MQIALLGPMQLEIAGALGSLRAPKHRSLLAALALQCRDVVTTDALADIVWDGRPPESWQTTIRNYIKQIRVAIGDDGACSAPTVPVTRSTSRAMTSTSSPSRISPEKEGPPPGGKTGTRLPLSSARRSGSGVALR